MECEDIESNDFDLDTRYEMVHSLSTRGLLL